DRGTRLQPRDDAQRMAVVRCQLLRRERERYEQFAIRIREIETARHDADNRIRSIVQPNGLADYLRVAAEAVEPEAVREERNRCARGRVILRRERTAEDRGHLQHAKKR